MPCKNSVLLTIVLVVTISHFARSIKVEYTAARLPIPVYNSALFYHESSNSIYIFGGVSKTNTDTTVQILRYHLTTDSVEYVGQLPEQNYYRGTVHVFEDVIHYFGDFYISTFDPNTNNATSIGRLPVSARDFHASFQSAPDSNFVNILVVPKFEDESTISLCLMGSTSCKPIHEGLRFYGYSAVVTGSHAYIFGKNSYWGYEEVLRLNMQSDSLEEIAALGAIFSAYSQAVSDGTHAYIIGTTERDGTLYPETLLQFNLDTESWKYLAVENFPWNDDVAIKYTATPSAVFVEKLNRVYYFGGLVKNTTSNTELELDDIWYVDLNPPLSTTTTDPPTSTTVNPATPTDPPTSAASYSTTDISVGTTSKSSWCQDKPNGMYPHPTDCSKFIGCVHGDFTEFDCPVPLHFDPLTSRCEHPSVVDCDSSCTGKQDGQYPHPDDCSLFILCQSEILSVSQCEPPLLFDPVLLICNNPEDVTCAELLT